MSHLYRLKLLRCVIQAPFAEELEKSLYNIQKGLVHLSNSHGKSFMPESEADLLFHKLKRSEASEPLKYRYSSVGTSAKLKEVTKTRSAVSKLKDTISSLLNPLKTSKKKLSPKTFNHDSSILKAISYQKSNKFGSYWFTNMNHKPITSILNSLDSLLSIKRYYKQIPKPIMRYSPVSKEIWLPNNDITIESPSSKRIKNIKKKTISSRDERKSIYLVNKKDFNSDKEIQIINSESKSLEAQEKDMRSLCSIVVKRLPRQEFKRRYLRSPDRHNHTVRNLIFHNFRYQIDITDITDARAVMSTILSSLQPTVTLKSKYFWFQNDKQNNMKVDLRSDKNLTINNNNHIKSDFSHFLQAYNTIEAKQALYRERKTTMLPHRLFARGGPGNSRFNNENVEYDSANKYSYRPRMAV